MSVTLIMSPCRHALHILEASCNGFIFNFSVIMMCCLIWDLKVTERLFCFFRHILKLYQVCSRYFTLMKFYLVLLLMPMTQICKETCKVFCPFNYMDKLLKDVRNLELLEMQHSVKFWLMITMCIVPISCTISKHLWIFFFKLYCWLWKYGVYNRL